MNVWTEAVALPCHAIPHGPCRRTAWTVMLIVNIYGAPATNHVGSLRSQDQPCHHHLRILLAMQNSRSTQSESLWVGSCILINKPSSGGHFTALFQLNLIDAHFINEALKFYAKKQRSGILRQYAPVRTFIAPSTPAIVAFCTLMTLYCSSQGD